MTIADEERAEHLKALKEVRSRLTYKYDRESRKLDKLERLIEACNDEIKMLEEEG